MAVASIGQAVIGIMAAVGASGIAQERPAPPAADRPSLPAEAQADPSGGQADRADSDDDTDADSSPPAEASPEMPSPDPGYQRTVGISNRNQATAACLAAVRARVGGDARPTRIEGLRGEWMVAGTIPGGQPFYCAIRSGAIADVELGG